MKNENEAKAKAIELAKQLHIYTPYVNDLKKGYRTLFECFGGYSIGKYDQELELLEKIKEIESKYNVYVYAVTHEYTDFGEIYDMLIVPEDKDGWDDLLYFADKGVYAYAYCWNKSDEWCSEFGDIFVQCFGGGIRRIG